MVFMLRVRLLEEMGAEPQREGITQAQFVEKIIKDELQRLDILK
ncbi:TPA: RepB family protein [Escherichia coli]